MLQTRRYESGNDCVSLCLFNPCNCFFHENLLFEIFLIVKLVTIRVAYNAKLS